MVIGECKGCRYFKPNQKQQGREGECRRYAPRPHADSDDLLGTFFVAFPVVFDDDWCGEFAERDA